MQTRIQYAKPELKRYGTFRDLTAAGIEGTSDGIYICGTPCETLSSVEQRS